MPENNQARILNTIFRSRRICTKILLLFLFAIHLSIHLPATSSDSKIKFIFYDPEWPFPKKGDIKITDIHTDRKELLSDFCKKLGAKLKKELTLEYVPHQGKLANHLGNKPAIGFINSKFIMENSHKDIVPILLPKINGSIFQQKCFLSADDLEIKNHKDLHKIRLVYYQQDDKSLARQISLLMGHKANNLITQLPLMHQTPSPESSILAVLYGVADCAYVPPESLWEFKNFNSPKKLSIHCPKKLMTYSPLIMTGSSPPDSPKSKDGIQKDILNIAQSHSNIFKHIGIDSLIETNLADFKSRNFIFYEINSDLEIYITTGCMPSPDNTNAILNIYIRPSKELKDWPFEYIVQIDGEYPEPRPNPKPNKRGKSSTQQYGLLKKSFLLRNSQMSLKTYRVKRGDNLSRISKKEFGNQSLRSYLFELNKSTLEDPDTLEINQEIKIPQTTYKIFLRDKREQAILVYEGRQLFTNEPITKKLNELKWGI